MNIVHFGESLGMGKKKEKLIGHKCSNAPFRFLKFQGFHGRRRASFRLQNISLLT